MTALDLFPNFLVNRGKIWQFFHISIVPMVGFLHFLNTIDFVLVSIRFGQRVLNDLKKARLSRGGMIWLLGPPPPHHFRVSKLDRRHSGRQGKREILLTVEGWKGNGRGGESYDRKKA